MPDPRFIFHVTCIGRAVISSRLSWVELGHWRAWLPGSPGSRGHLLYCINTSVLLERLPLHALLIPPLR